jgi:RNA polymerase sigma-70 factor (ECF subfamily)
MTTEPERGTSAADTVSTASERELLEAARGGDDDAFSRLAGPYRGELYAHCYRMLGSAADAEDALQETLLRAWRALPQFEGRSSVRSWLYKIATNACLRAIERRPRRVLPIDYGPAADPHDGPADPVTEGVWLEPYADEGLGLGSGLASPEARYEQREGVELAFIAALQHLPARQRAVLILRDVLGFSARETATALETTPVSVDSALQRAHKTVDQRLPQQSQQATLRSLSDDALRQVVQRYVSAWERNDIDAVVAMLTEDAKLAMPPLPTWYRGRDQVASFLSRWQLARATRWRLIPTRANGQLAFGLYAWDDKTQTFMPRAIDVLTLRGAQIEQITAFLTPDAFRTFDLPASLPASETNP